MQIFIPIDEKEGMFFNKRRQSKDKLLINYILSICGNDKLYINNYSASLFEDDSKLVIDDDFMLNAPANSYCFVENINLSTYLNRVNIIYLCKWNRTYPSDFKLDVDVKSNFKLISSTDIEGSSHKKITIEVWEK